MITFKMKIARDKAKPWQEDIQEICESLRNRDIHPQGWERDDNNFHIGGHYGASYRYSDPERRRGVERTEV